MDQVTQAVFGAQIAAQVLAVKALISTHPDGRAFAKAFSEHVASFQSSPAYLEAGEEMRAMFRAQCDALLEEAHRSN